MQSITEPQRTMASSEVGGGAIRAETYSLNIRTNWVAGMLSFSGKTRI